MLRDMRRAVAAAPSYFEMRAKPETPRDLPEHNTVNLHLHSYGGAYAWEFEKDGQELKVRVEGQLTCNSLGQIQNAALCGLGLAIVPEDMAQEHLESGRLVRVLDDWRAPLSGFHLYYPSRRQASAAFTVLVDALRYRP